MGTGLLTSTGFDPYVEADIRANATARYKASFGNAVDLSADTELGKLLEIDVAKELKLWERLQELYDAMYPDSASGAALDLVAQITGALRNGAVRSTADLYVRGAVATIPQFSVVETSDTGIPFRTKNAFTLPAAHTLTDVAEGASNDLVQAAGTATVTYPTHGFLVGEFVWFQDCDQPEYNGVKTILTVPNVNTFTFAIDSGAASPATGTVTGYEAYLVESESVEYGVIQALAGTLTEITNAVSGWDEVTNLVDAVLGRVQEKDPPFRARRTAALSGLGNATIDAVRGALLNVANVTFVEVFENDTDVDVGTRTPHTLEAVVIGGADQDIWDSILANKAGGIGTVGAESGTSVDSSGNNHTINFSRPTEIEIYLDLTLTTDSDYPSGGDALVEQAILDWSETLSMGDDVIVYPYLVGAIIGVPGITDVVVDIGTSASPSGDANIVIAETEIAVFDSARINFL